MKETVLSLEYNLNSFIDQELEKENFEINDSFIMECCDGLLRLDNEIQYIISEKEMCNNIKKIINHNHQHTKTKNIKSIKALLIAALIALFLTIAAFGYVQYRYNIIHSYDHSIVFFNNPKRNMSSQLSVKYLPSEFKLCHKTKSKYIETLEYKKDNLYINISKSTKEYSEDINTEYEKYSIISIDNIDYIEYGDISHGQGIIWDNSGYVYCVCGNISKSDLLKIAISVS